MQYVIVICDFEDYAGLTTKATITIYKEQSFESIVSAIG